MIAIRYVFDWLAAWYNPVAEPWLHIHFAVRTLIILLLAWAAVFVAAQVVKFIIGPLCVLIFYHVFFRAWNYLLVETAMEWIYIRYFSQEKLFLSGTYLKLCDKVRTNRLKLEHTKYKGIIISGGVSRFTNRLMVTALVCVTLFIAAFGLYHEFGMTKPEPTEQTSQTREPLAAPQATPTDKPYPSVLPVVSDEPQGLFFAGATNLVLNEYGADGANVRNMPGSAESTVVEVLNGEAAFGYLGEYARDANDETLYWLKIETGHGTVGYISSKLVRVKN